MSATRCWAPGCTAAWLYDGLCERHLWEAEHTSTYMGGPHITPHADCPLCVGARRTPSTEEDHP